MIALIIEMTAALSRLHILDSLDLGGLSGCLDVFCVVFRLTFFLVVCFVVLFVYPFIASDSHLSFTKYQRYFLDYNILLAFFIDLVFGNRLFYFQTNREK